MNELLHKFKLGYEAELLLEKRGGGYEKVATVPIGSQALGVTQSESGVGRLLKSGGSAQQVGVVPTRGETIVIVGDSLVEGAASSFKLVRSRDGFKKLETWDSSSVSTSQYTAFNPGSLRFVDKLRGNAACANSDTWALEFDGVSKLRANVAGEGFGPWLDVTNGGWFELLSAGGSKGLLCTVRFNYKPTVPASASNALGSFRTQSSEVFALGSIYSAALARIGFAAHDIYIQGLGGQTLLEILDRIDFVLAAKPTLVLLEGGINSYLTFDATHLQRLADYIATLNAIGAMVVMTTPMSCGIVVNAADAAKLAYAVKEIKGIRSKYPALAVEIIDGFSASVNPTGTFGTGLIYAEDFAADNLHPTLAGLVNKFTPAALPALSKLLPPSRISIAGAIDMYDATGNPTGSVIGTMGALVGTGGTKDSGANGDVPTGWVDDVNSSPSAWSSVTYTAPQSASSVARGDGLPGNVMVMSCKTAGASGSVRRVRAVCSSGQFVIGNRYKADLGIRLKDVSYLTGLTIMLQHMRNSGESVTQNFTVNPGLPWPSTAAQIADSGVLYLSADPVTIPADYSGTTYITISVTCGVGGSIDVHLNPDVSVRLVS